MNDAPVQPASSSRIRRLPRPRIETIVLLLALVGTLGAKAEALRRCRPDHFLIDLLRAGLSDGVFFAALFLLLALLRRLPRPRLAARLALVAALVAAAWSVANAGWLLATGGQLQPGMLGIAVLDLDQSLIVARDYATRNVRRVIPLALFGIVMAAVVIRSLIRPRPIPLVAARRNLAAPAALLLGALLARAIATAALPISVWGSAIDYSSHGHALAGLFAGDDDEPADEGGRAVPVEGERDLGATPAGPRPNVLVIMLESVPRSATSLSAGEDDRPRARTPALARVAAEGVEFVSTRVPVALTTKAWWTTFTGLHPDLHLDAVESVLRDEPVESLPTILRRAGYRSAYFQMAMGTWDAAPGLFWNLGFDFAWFRENLRDPSAHLGWMSGDDLRMVEPMLDWVDGAEGPFLLGCITSITHIPYELPAWYDDPPAESEHRRYLQTLECADRLIDALLAGLEARGILDETIVCVLGDHGEGFRPDMRGARWAPYEEVIRVPWVLRWPAGIEPGTRVDWPCSQLDVTPTLLNLLGWDVSRAGFEGRVATAPAPPDRRLYFSCWYRNSPMGFVEGDRKLVWWPRRETLYVYDLAADPLEERPAILEGPERDEAVRAIEAWRRASYFSIPPKRFREGLLFGHWATAATGRRPTTYFVEVE